MEQIREVRVGEQCQILLVDRPGGDLRGNERRAGKGLVIRAETVPSRVAEHPKEEHGVARSLATLKQRRFIYKLCCSSSLPWVFFFFF